MIAASKLGPVRRKLLSWRQSTFAVIAARPVHQPELGSGCDVTVSVHVCVFVGLLTNVSAESRVDSVESAASGEKVGKTLQPLTGDVIMTSS